MQRILPSRLSLVCLYTWLSWYILTSCVYLQEREKELTLPRLSANMTEDLKWEQCLYISSHVLYIVVGVWCRFRGVTSCCRPNSSTLWEEKRCVIVLVTRISLRSLIEKLFPCVINRSRKGLQRVNLWRWWRERFQLRNFPVYRSGKPCY